MKSYLIISLFLFLGSQFSAFGEEYSKLIAQSLWNALPDKKLEYFSEFKKGMVDFKNAPNEGELCEIYDREQKAKDQLALKNQLSEADSFFQNLKNKNECIEIVPNKVYSKIKKEGEGFKIKHTDYEIKAIYKIETIDGEVLLNPNYEETEAYPLKSLMPGLALGMMGMKKGEKREIWIHPEYGHDDILLLEGHPALHVKVQLQSFSPVTPTSEPITPFHFSVSNVDLETLERNYNNLHMELAYKYGQSVWAHYNWGEPEYNLEEVLKYLDVARDQTLVDLTSDELHSKLENLHWKIYNNPSCYPIFPL